MAERDTLDDLKCKAAQDQVGAGLADFAQNLLDYRAALIRGGMTAADANRLALEYQRLAMCKAFWPDRPPTFNPGGDE